jgi:4-hydroxy-2-oxoheptanedioate aldolase
MGFRTGMTRFDRIIRRLDLANGVRRADQWIYKQALDLGVMGFFFNELGTKEEAMKYVPIMRKFPRKGLLYTGPIGTRGSGGGPAAWFWGLTGEEYDEHADLWPINPEGDLLMVPMIETIEGVHNSMEIAKVLASRPCTSRGEAI